MPIETRNLQAITTVKLCNVRRLKATVALASIPEEQGYLVGSGQFPVKQ